MKRARDSDENPISKHYEDLEFFLENGKKEPQGPG